VPQCSLQIALECPPMPTVPSIKRRMPPSTLRKTWGGSHGPGRPGGVVGESGDRANASAKGAGAGRQ